MSGMSVLSEAPASEGRESASARTGGASNRSEADTSPNLWCRPRRRNRKGVGWVLGDATHVTPSADSACDPAPAVKPSKQLASFACTASGAVRFLCSESLARKLHHCIPRRIGTNLPNAL